MTEWPSSIGSAEWQRALTLTGAPFRSPRPRVTTYAKILHIRCSGTGLGGALGGDSAAGHTTCVLQHISGDVESLISLPQAARRRADMRGGVGECTGHRAIDATGNRRRRLGLSCRTAITKKLTRRWRLQLGSAPPRATISPMPVLRPGFSAFEHY